MPPEAGLSFTVHDEIPHDEHRIIDAGLSASNDAAAPLHEVRPLACFARLETGDVVGGAVGRTWGLCCELQQLWVEPNYRRHGIGTRLVSEFERRAAERGCRTFYLETFSFQAPAFYQALGYQARLELNGFADGISKYVMVRGAEIEAGNATSQTANRFTRGVALQYVQPHDSHPTTMLPEICFRVAVSDGASLDAVRGLLRSHNERSNPVFWRKFTDPANAPQRLEAIACDGSEVVVGGLLAETALTWLRIHVLAVREDLRRQGIGRHLLELAEDEAQRRSCKYAYVDTMEYQSPEFYRRCGYEMVGRLLDWDSHGHAKYLFVKRLAA